MSDNLLNGYEAFATNIHGQAITMAADGSVHVSEPSDRKGIRINLLDEVTYGGDTQLPFFAPTAQATFTPLNKGRIYGLEIQFLTN